MKRQFDKWLILQPQTPFELDEKTDVMSFYHLKSHVMAPPVLLLLRAIQLLAMQAECSHLKDANKPFNTSTEYIDRLIRLIPEYIN